MDLLESVLRSANAEQYINTLKKHCIEPSTLPLLTDNDLQELGVDDENIRKEIILKSSTLQIHHEKKISLNIDKEYAELVLNQISHQLHLHNASLTCALNRKDIAICNIELRRASQCLLNSITSLEKELDRFENKFVPGKKRKSKNRKYILVGCTLVTSSLALCILGRLVKNCITK